MNVTSSQSRRTTARGQVSRNDLDVDRAIQQRLFGRCPYAHCYRDVQWSYEDGVLVLTGRVPSFYLKQMLQTWLQDLPGVRRIENRTDVINSEGLSSVRIEPGHMV